jgi:hypothetical protein
MCGAWSRRLSLTRLTVRRATFGFARTIPRLMCEVQIAARRHSNSTSTQASFYRSFLAKRCRSAGALLWRSASTSTCVRPSSKPSPGKTSISTARRFTFTGRSTASGVSSRQRRRRLRVSFASSRRCFRCSERYTTLPGVWAPSSSFQARRTTQGHCGPICGALALHAPSFTPRQRTSHARRSRSTTAARPASPGARFAATIRSRS